jgi:hypothetical protein
MTPFRNIVGSVLKEIVKSYWSLKSKFTEQDNNLSVPLYCNKAYGYGRALQNKLDEYVFEINGNNDKRDQLLSITWSDISRGGGFSYPGGRSLA